MNTTELLSHPSKRLCRHHGQDRDSGSEVTFGPLVLFGCISSSEELGVHDGRPKQGALSLFRYLEVSHGGRGRAGIGVEIDESAAFPLSLTSHSQKCLKTLSINAAPYLPDS